MDNDNKKLSIYNDNNSNLDKKVVKIEFFFHANTQRDCNLAAVKPELFDNIPLVLDVNNLKYCGKAIHKVESSSTERKLSVVKRVDSSSAERNLPII